jgi:predicted Ser/Thr protein kinase
MSELHVCPQCGSEIPANAPAGLCPKCLLKAGLESQPPVGPESGGAPTSAAASGFTPPSAAELAARFPQLEILELLGKGGMGAVYKARQPGLDRTVAIKILPPEVGHDPAFAERFTREARALARLSHPNIVAVYDFGRSDGLYYFVMEYVDGVNLRQALASGITTNDALAIVPQVCDALQFAHDEGIVHRDIKPENILIDKRGRVKIADFGLAKLVGQELTDRALTATHQVMGTLRYMAPEQMEGAHEVDHRADIYSLGVVFYELLTGELPIGRFAPPSKKVQIDVRLDEVVLRALDKEPEQRFQHASDVKIQVEAICGVGRPSSQSPSASSEAVASGSLSPPKPSFVNWVVIPMLVLLGLWLAASMAAMRHYGQLDDYQPLAIMQIQLAGLLFLALAFVLLVLARWMRTLPVDVRRTLLKRLVLSAAAFSLAVVALLMYFVSPWNQPYVEAHDVTFQPKSKAYEVLHLACRFISHTHAEEPYLNSDDRLEVWVRLQNGNLVLAHMFVGVPELTMRPNQHTRDDERELDHESFLAFVKGAGLDTSKPEIAQEADELYMALMLWKHNQPGRWSTFLDATRTVLKHYDFGEDLGTKSYVEGNPSPKFLVAFGLLVAGLVGSVVVSIALARSAGLKG